MTIRMNTLPKELLRRLRQLMRQTTRHGHFHRRGVWLLGLAILLPSVTIAAIIPRGGDVPPAGSLIPATPPQTVLLGNTILSEVSNGLAPSPATTEPPAPNSSNRETWTEITVRKGAPLSDILKRQGSGGNEISRVIQSNPGAHVFPQVHPGQTLRV